MTCGSARNLLEAYLDGELDVSGQAAVQEHVESCPACAEDYARMQAIASEIRKQAPYHKAPVHLRERILTELRTSEQPTPARRAPVWRWTAIAASVLLGCSIAWNISTLRSREDPIAEQILSSHLRSLAGNHLLDVRSSDQHTVKPWFNGKLDFSPDVKDFASHGFPLIGGRIEYLDVRPTAALVYQRRQHVINLFIKPSSGRSNKEVARNGFNIIEWTARGMNYWAVSDLNRAELEQFARLNQQ